MLGAVDRAVLAACAAEADHQAAEAAAGVCLHMRIHHAVYMVKETEHFPVILQENIPIYVSDSAIVSKGSQNM